MSLWCSLLGHRFEGRDVERERDEREDEVLTVTREIETCGRCGARRVITESTEVARVQPAPDHLTEDTAGPTESGSSGRSIEPRDPADEDTEILEADSGREPGEWPPEPGDDSFEDGSDGGGRVPPANREGHPGSQGRSGGSETSVSCPECGFATDVAGSSLRAGDSCPDCQIGYLEST